MNIVKFIKSKKTFNTILFVILVPEIEDRNGDIISEDEIIETAHEFMINSNKKKININHSSSDEVDEEEYDFVESYIMPCEFVVDEDNDLIIPKWSWVLWIKFSDEVYEDILDGKYVWVSMEWFWKREKI